jgi:SAM-dependent methyltransferase
VHGHPASTDHCPDGPSFAYDEIGRTYARTRRPDQRLAREVDRALGPARTILNVGAGSGNYEPAGRVVVALEPSMAMIRQRTSRAAVVRGSAERLPFADAAFDAAMALLTMHHWHDPAAGLDELRRVSRRQVIWYCEPLDPATFWPLRYFPEASRLPFVASPPGEALLRARLDVREIRTLRIPSDCTDGFGVAYWARPEAYLDPIIQDGMSWLALLDPAARRSGTARLAEDLASGAWERHLGHLRTQPDFDGGLRIAIAR